MGILKFDDETKNKKEGKKTVDVLEVMDKVLTSQEIDKMDEQDLKDELKITRQIIKNVKENIEENKAKRKKLNVKVGAFLTIMSLAVGGASDRFYQERKHITEGKDAIADNFYDTCMQGVGWNNSTDGFIFVSNGQYISYEEAVNLIKSRAQEQGINDVDIYISISQIISKNVAKDFVKIPDRKDIDRRAYEVYLEHELEEVKTNGK